MPLSDRRVVGFATGDAATAAFLWRVSRCSSGGEGFVFDDADDVEPRVCTFVCGSVDNRFERRVVGVVVSSGAITTGVELRVCRFCGGV